MTIVECRINVLYRFEKKLSFCASQSIALCPMPSAFFPHSAFRLPNSTLFTFAPSQLPCLSRTPYPVTRDSHPVPRNPQRATRHRTLTIFGSSVSRNPSPSKLKPKTAQAMANPGKIAIQGASDIKVWASLSMRPQEAWGGWVPRPR